MDRYGLPIYAETRMNPRLILPSYNATLPLWADPRTNGPLSTRMTGPQVHFCVASLKRQAKWACRDLH